MRKEEIKSIIVELREKEKTFAEISDILKEVYGVTMSRQAVCGMYRRLTEKSEENKDIKMIVFRVDIINFHLIGLTNEEIRELLKKRYDIEFTAYSIQSIIDSKADYLKRVSDEKVEKIANHIMDVNSPSTIVDILKYKGIKPKERVVKEFTIKAVNQLMRQRAVEIASNIVDETGSSSIIKQINKMYRFNITLKETKGIEDKDNKTKK